MSKIDNSPGSSRPTQRATGLNWTGIEPGPRVPDSVQRLLRPAPTPDDILGPSDELSIRDARFRAVLVNRDVDKNCIQGRLSAFFVAGGDGQVKSDGEAEHTPAAPPSPRTVPLPCDPRSFSPERFCRQIERWFGIKSREKWQLWAQKHVDHPAYRLSTEEHFWVALQEFETYFLKSPLSRFEMYFLVEVIQPQPKLATANHLAKRQPKQQELRTPPGRANTPSCLPLASRRKEMDTRPFPPRAGSASSPSPAGHGRTKIDSKSSQSRASSQSPRSSPALRKKAGASTAKTTTTAASTTAVSADLSRRVSGPTTRSGLGAD